MFDSTIHARQAIMGSESSGFKIDIAGTAHSIMLRPDKPRGVGEKRASSEASRFVGLIMPEVKAMFPQDVVSIAPYQKLGEANSRARLIYRESTRSFIRNTVAELTLSGDTVKHVNIVCQGFSGQVRDGMTGRLLELFRSSGASQFQIDIVTEMTASTQCTPTKKTSTLSVASGVLPTGADNGGNTSGQTTTASGPAGSAGNQPSTALGTTSAPSTPSLLGTGELNEALDRNVDMRTKRKLEFDEDGPTVVSESVVAG